jgi:predicted permease
MGLERWRYVLPLRLRSLFRGPAVDRDLDEELQYHLERQIELNIEQGMTPKEARYAALRALDGLEQHKETMRDHRRVAFADMAMRDLRYGLRVLRRSPIFASVAILSLALGVGANAAMFQLIDAISLRSLPVVNPEELLEVRPGGPQAFGNYDNFNSRVTYPLWEELRAHQTAFSGLFAWGNADLLIGRGTSARAANGLWVSGDTFAVLGLSPQRGRLLAPADDRRGCGASPVVVSHGFWQTYFGGGDAVVGSTLTVFDHPFTVVGVTPATFTGLEVGQTFDVALPLCAAALFDGRLDSRDHWWLTVMGRRAPGWTIAQADQQLRALSPRLLAATVPSGYNADLLEGYRALRFEALPAAHGVSRLRDSHGTSLAWLLGLTGLVLLMTCGNLATLLLARATAREREIAVRVAIGATRARIVSQMLVESLMVAAGGAVLAVPVALFSARALVAFLDTATAPVSLPLTADWRLIAFVGGTAVLTAVLFGLLPAVRVSMADPIVAMRSAARGLSLDRRRARVQQGLVVAQVAVSLVLVVSALLFVQTFRNLARVDTGFEQTGTLAVSFFDLAAQALPAARKTAFQEELTNEIGSIPGVAAAASSSHVPLSGGTWSHFFRVTARASADRKASRFAYVGPRYFETLRIPIRAGRAFHELDNAGSRRVLLVNEAFVRSHLAGLNPIGATIHTLAEPGFPETTYEIVGVVGDTKYGDLREENCWCDTPSGPMAPIAYVPIAQNPVPYAWTPILVRSSGAVSGLAAAIAKRVEQLNPAIVVNIVELRTQVRERIIREQMLAWLAGAFGVLALLVVVIGLYGIIAYLAATRRNEIGIRLSLGSTRMEIARLVLRDIIALLAVGLMIGLPLALAATRAAAALLFGLTPTDVPTIVSATALLATAALVAGALPAWRAARVRLEEALRTE